MKLESSVWSNYFYDLTPEERIDAFLEAGFTASEFSDEDGAILLGRGDPVEEGEKLRHYAEERGFSFPQGHLYLRVNICEDDAVPVLEKWIDLFCALGIKAGVLHAAGGAGLTAEERLEKRASTIKALCDHIGDRDFTICLENLMGDGNPCSSGALLELIAKAEELGADGRHLGICLDTGHLHVSQTESQRDFILNAGCRLKALHIAENDTSTDQHLMPFGTPFGGKGINWKEVMTSLSEVGYSGLFNMEIPGESRCPIEVRRGKLKYARILCDYMTESMI